MVWIRVIDPAAAEGRLGRIYRQAAGAGPVDQILQAHSLREHTLEGHMALYRSVLHHPRNRLEPSFAEAIGVLVSRINGCAYCVSHHRRGMQEALGDRGLADAWSVALDCGRYDAVFDRRQRAALDWAGKVTRAPQECSESDIEALRRAGWDDGEILEICQVSAYFAYANRVVLGLGVTTRGEGPGAPSAA